MKTIVIISIVLLSVQSYAQEVGSMKLGISAGSMISFARGIDVKQVKDDINDDESLQGSRYIPKPGLQLGATLSYRLTQTFSTEMKLTYNQRGWIFRLEKHDDQDYQIIKTNVTINYLDIPMLISYHSNEKFSLTGGILTSIATNNKVKAHAEASVNGEYTEVSEIGSFHEAFYYDPKRVLLGLYAGCGIQLSNNMALDIHIQKTAAIQPKIKKDYANLSFGISLIKQFSIATPDLPTQKTRGPKVIE